MTKRVMIISLVFSCLFVSAFLLPNTVCAQTHELYIPYNVKGNGWWTGWHIMPRDGGAVFSFFFENNGMTFASFSTTIPSGGWTGLVENLLTLVGFDPSSFLSPAMIHVYTSSGPFTVTQFVGTDSLDHPGFGFQTFYSWPFSNDWPHTSVP